MGVAQRSTLLLLPLSLLLLYYSHSSLLPQPGLVAGAGGKEGGGEGEGAGGEEEGGGGEGGEGKMVGGREEEGGEEEGGQEERRGKEGRGQDEGVGAKGDEEASIDIKMAECGCQRKIPLPR